MSFVYNSPAVSFSQNRNINQQVNSYANFGQTSKNLQHSNHINNPPFMSARNSSNNSSTQPQYSQINNALYMATNQQPKNQSGGNTKLTQMSTDLARLKQQLSKIMNQADKFQKRSIQPAQNISPILTQTSNLSQIPFHHQSLKSGHSQNKTFSSSPSMINNKQNLIEQKNLYQNTDKLSSNVNTSVSLSSIKTNQHLMNNINFKEKSTQKLVHSESEKHIGSGNNEKFGKIENYGNSWQNAQVAPTSTASYGSYTKGSVGYGAGGNSTGKFEYTFVQSVNPNAGHGKLFEFVNLNNKSQNSEQNSSANQTSSKDQEQYKGYLYNKNLSAQQPTQKKVTNSFLGNTYNNDDDYHYKGVSIIKGQAKKEQTQQNKVQDNATHIYDPTISNQRYQIYGSSQYTKPILAQKQYFDINQYLSKGKKDQESPSYSKKSTEKKSDIFQVNIKNNASHFQQESTEKNIQAYNSKINESIASINSTRANYFNEKPSSQKPSTQQQKKLQAQSYNSIDYSSHLKKQPSKQQNHQVVINKIISEEYSKKLQESAEFQQMKKKKAQQELEYQQKIIGLQHQKRKLTHELNSLRLQKENLEGQIKTEISQKQTISKKYAEVEQLLSISRQEVQEFKTKCRLIQKKLDIELSRPKHNISGGPTTFDEALKQQITQIQQYKGKLQEKQQQIIRLKEVNTMHRREIEALNNQIKIQQLKGASQLNEADQKHSGTLQDKENEIKTQKHLIGTLESKLAFAIKENKTKDAFMVQHLTGKAKIGEQKEYIQNFFKTYEVEFPSNNFAQKIKEQQIQIERLKRTIFELMGSSKKQITF